MTAELEGFRLVHEGGHHEVWCNGEIHKRTTGGTVWPNEVPKVKPRERPFRCDCAKWGGNG